MNLFLKHKAIMKHTYIVLNMILTMTNEQMQYNVYSSNVINNINLLINALVSVNDNIEPVLLIDGELAENMEELAKYFVDIIYCYEHNESDEVRDIFKNRLIPKFRKLYKNFDLYSYNMKSVRRW